MKTKRKNHIYFADFETITAKSKEYQELGHTDVYLWAIIREDEDISYKGKTLDEFFEYIEKDYRSKTIYFHNLSFDGDFIMKWLFRNRPEQFKDKGINEDKKHNYYECFRQNRRIYKITLNYRKRVGNERIKFNIRILCSYNLIQSSIESLGKGLGISKHDEAEERYWEEKTGIEFYNLGGFHIWDNMDLLKVYYKYIDRDVKIAKLAYQNYRKKMEYDNEDAFSLKYQKRNILLPNILTAASLAQKIVKNVIYNKEEDEEVKKGWRLRTYEEYELARNWYSGGFSQFNEEYQNNEFSFSGLCIDINSSYPYVMTLNLPYGKLMLGRNSDEFNYINYVRVEIEFYIKSKYYFLPCIKDKYKSTRYARYGKGTYYWTEKEFKFYKKIYDIDVINITYYHSKAKPYLKNFIDKYYQFKVDADKNKNNAEKLTYKIFLNSLYGSFAKKANYPSLIYVSEKNWAYIKQRHEENEDYTIFINDEEWKPHSFSSLSIPELGLRAINMINISKKAKSYPNMLVGATITSWARLYLLETIVSLGVENFIYCDTDSIFFKWDKSEKDLPKNIILDDYKLGAWKIEARLTKGIFTGSKRYVFETISGKTKYALGGITMKKDAEYDLIQQYLNSNKLIPKGKLQRVEDRYGIILVEKDVLLKSGTI